MEYFFTADQHFNHTKIINYCNRDFSSKQEMNTALINSWNSVVSEKDIVYQLGDFSFGNWKMVYNIINELNGFIYFIYSPLQHDYWAKHFIKHKLLKDKIEFLEPIYKIKVTGINIVLSHFPLESWAGSFRGHLHFHGHTHGKSTSRHNRLDVGVDTNNKYVPYSLHEALGRMVRNGL